jgi:pyruvate,water dikinase
MVRFPRRLPGMLARYQAEIRALSQLPMDGLPDAEIVSRVRKLVFEDASLLLNYDFLMIAVIGRTYDILGTLLERSFGQRTEELRAKLISGVTGNVTMETNKQIWDLARIAKASRTVSRILRQADGAEALARLQKEPQAQDFLRELNRFLTEYGHREIRMDILYPTWGEDPAPVLSFIRGCLDSDEKQSPHYQQARLVGERQALTEEALHGVERGLIGRSLLAPLFRWVLRQTQLHTRERDTMHFELTRLFPPVRRLFRELGRRWTDRGWLSQAEDIYYLSLDEMAELAEAPRPVHSLIVERRAEFVSNQGRPWPLIVRGGQEIYAEAPSAQPAAEGGLRGIAGSPGVAAGTARVIRSPAEFPRLQRGDILVAPLTNPVWTPLFAIAGGVITEVGGILSHGAIVAREYGIPAVMSVAGATRLLVDGIRITVDGNRGVVMLEGAA